MIYIHKKINCTINVRGETKKEKKVANNTQTYTCQKNRENIWTHTNT